MSEIAWARRAELAVFGLDTWATANDTPLVEAVESPDEAVARAITAALAQRHPTS